MALPVLPSRSDSSIAQTIRFEYKMTKICECNKAKQIKKSRIVTENDSWIEGNGHCHLIERKKLVRSNIV